MKIKAQRPPGIATCLRWTASILLLIAANALGAPKFVPFGVDFSPYQNGQNPLPGTLVLKPSQVLNRLKAIRGDSVWVRNYSVTHGMETAGALAHQAGFKVALGAWLGPETDAAGAGLASNKQEISNLISAANRGEADLLVVGNEVLQSNYLTATKLIAYMQQVRSSGPSTIPVTTDDTYNELLANTDVIAASDIVMANFYPYWEGTRIDGAIASLDSEYHALAQVSGTKAIWVGETGWPSAGAAVDLAVPGPQNAAYYFLAFNSWAWANNVNAFYFEAYDETWKAQSEGSQGAHWGIRNSAGAFKKGINLVYEGYTLPPAVFMREAAATLSGTPAIQLTSIPAYGSTKGIAGVVSGIGTASYDVATYIRVSGGWWSKPTFADPTVPIAADGSFTCAIVTGGNDRNATEIEAFVVAAGYVPPAANGVATLPDALFTNSVAYIDVPRPVGFFGTTVNIATPVIESLSVARNFGATARAGDIVTVIGTLPIEDAKAAGANVTVNIGSAAWQFAPVAKDGIAVVNGGNCKNPTGRIAITAEENRWVFSARMVCAPGNTNWDKEGLLNTTLMAPGIPVFLPVTVTVGSQSYSATASGYYIASEAKTGSMVGAGR